MYSVKQVALMLGISTKTVYRYVNKMEMDNVQGYVKGMSNGMSNGNDNTFKPTITINDIGISYIKNKGIIIDNDTPQLETQKVENNNDSELIISILQQQLKEKDLQIIEKDKQISTLLKQAENYQMLLAQNLLSPQSACLSVEPGVVEEPPKRKWWQRKK